MPLPTLLPCPCRLPITKGTVYYVVVDQWSTQAADQGNFTLTISLGVPRGARCRRAPPPGRRLRACVCLPPACSERAGRLPAQGEL